MIKFEGSGGFWLRVDKKVVWDFMNHKSYYIIQFSAIEILLPTASNQNLSGQAWVRLSICWCKKMQENAWIFSNFHITRLHSQGRVHHRYKRCRDHNRVSATPDGETRFAVHSLTSIISLLSENVFNCFTATGILTLWPCQWHHIPAINGYYISITLAIDVILSLFS